jgi:diguanylate cyclase (GGDEF)-like protein
VRLKAMRAGIDLTLPMPVTAADVVQRVHELALGEAAVHYRILIVEDDRSQALFAESVLRKAGMETCAVTDPLETISALEQFRPDLILMDLYMPGIDGMELTSIIREREDFISTPIVFLSGEQDSEKHFEALSAGGDDFLAKPIRPKHLISAVTNRARRARTLKQRKSAATPRDAESGLYERAFVLDKLGELFGQDELRTSVAFLEIDGATRLREQYGVAGVDALIVQLCSGIVSTLGDGEYASRYGDASLLVLASSRSAPSLAELAGHWRKQVSAGLYELDGKVVPLQVSIGVAELTPGLSDAAALINAAERAMLQARQPSSRDKVRIYAPERQRSEEDYLLDALGRALKLEDFQMLFQPIVALGSTGQEQYEVQLRLRTDDGKLLAAAQFMPVANKHNLAADVDRFLLSRALSIIDERRRQGRVLRLFVNQAAASLLDANRPAWLKQMLDTRKLPADQLVLLFNFAELLPQLRAAIPFFQAMRGASVRLGLDQFESNLTALQLLGYLPTDYLRLAHKYVGAQGVVGAEELRAMVSAAHDGGRQVIAARVENAQTAAALWSLGVDLIQGNFVQQPGAELGFDFSTSAL